MSIKFQNKSRNNINIILEGKRIKVKPNDFIDGPKHLEQYSGLTIVKTKEENERISIVGQLISDYNRKECLRVLDEIKKHDSSKPFPRENYKKSSSKNTFSIITLSNNKEQYENFVNDLLQQDFKETFEIIWLRNFQNEFKSCAEALNFGISLANSTYCALTHQDIRCDKDWLTRVHSHFTSLEKNHKVGFLGIAGTTKLGASTSSEQGALYLRNSAKELVGHNISFAELTRQKWGSFKEVQVLDECVMFCRTDLGIMYDDLNFDHYHWYGADICIQALMKGYKNYAIDAAVEHLSDGQQNLVNDAHAKSYIKHGSILLKKWKGKIPYIRSTTASLFLKDGFWLPLILGAVNEKYGTKHPTKIIVK